MGNCLAQYFFKPEAENTSAEPFDFEIQAARLKRNSGAKASVIKPPKVAVIRQRCQKSNDLSSSSTSSSDSADHEMDFLTTCVKDCNDNATQTDDPKTYSHEKYTQTDAEHKLPIKGKSTSFPNFKTKRNSQQGISYDRECKLNNIVYGNKKHQQRRCSAASSITKEKSD